jgi:hypothetical protein
MLIIGVVLLLWQLWRWLRGKEDIWTLYAEDAKP